MAQSKRGLARRDFLIAIGRAVGGSAMLRTMLAMGIGVNAAACGSSSASPAPGRTPLPPPASAPPSPRPGDWPGNVGAGRSVVILGAGIAGMSAALEMRRLGYAVRLLEAQSSAGGRVRTIRSGDVVNEIDSIQTCQFDADPGLYFNAGPSRIAHHHEFLLAYCREFGVELEAFNNDNRGAWLHSAGAFNGQPQPARRLVADSRGGLAELLSTAISQNALDQQLSAQDKSNVLAMLRQFGDLDAANRYLGSTRAGFPGQETVGSRQRGELLSPRQLQQLVSDFFWELRLSFPESLEQQPVMLQAVGGMDRIARAFESQLGAEIVYESRVTEIRKRNDGVRIVYSDRSASSIVVDADYAVVTIPAPVLAGLPNDFSSAHAAEIAAFQYTSAVRLALQSPRFWEREHNIYGGISWTDQDITQIWYPNHDFLNQQGIILAAYIFGGAAGDRFTAMTPQQRIDTALSEAAAVHPQLPGLANHGISVAWEKMPFQRGAWGVSRPVSLLTPDDNIVFAGEHLSILQGWQEGAILSAYAAIDQVVSRDLAR